MRRQEMSWFKTNSESKKTLRRRVGRVFLPMLLVAAAVAILVVLPSSLASERKKDDAPKDVLYGVTYDKAKRDLPDEWVWRVRPVTFERMYRSKKR